MICSSCKNDLPKEDFLLTNECFRCIYKKKIENSAEKEVNVKYLCCIVCDKKLVGSRRKYCCEECGYVGKMRKDKKMWHKNVNAPQGQFKV